MPVRLRFISIALVASAVATASADDFRGLYDQATLEMGKQTFPRRRVESPWNSEIRIGAMRYRIEGDTVVQADGETRKVLKQVRAPDGATLRWKGAVRDVAFLVDQIKMGMNPRKTPLPVIRRLDLKTMEWLTPIEVELEAPAESKALEERERTAVKAWQERLKKQSTKQEIGQKVETPQRLVGLIDVLIAERGTVVLSCLGLGVQGGLNRTILGFQVSLTPPGSEKPEWSRWIDFPESPHETSFFVTDPSLAYESNRPAINRLTWTKTGIVVFLPISQELLCLNGKGVEEWRLPRIWEFERWNIGPSSGYWEIDRFGFHVDDGVTAGTPEGADSKLAEAHRKAAQDEIDKEVRGQLAVRAERSQRFYKDFRAGIAAGPILVQPLDDEHDDERLFVAVGKTRYPYNVTAAAECVIYQVNAAGGWIDATSFLPRMVYRRPHLSIPGGSVWACEGGSLAKIGISHSDDLRCCIEWYREYPDLLLGQDDWDSEGSGAGTRLACSTAEMLFRTGFKYDLHVAENVLSFQINVVDLESGLAREMTLSLPFAGIIPDREAKPEGDANCAQGFGPPKFQIAIELMEIEADTLRIVVRTGKLQTGLEFDIRALVKKSVRD